jgi:hypothetical protein
LARSFIESRRDRLDNPAADAASYLPMSLTEWFWPNSRPRGLETIGSIAARYRILAASLERHAAACAYPTIRAGLQRLAATKFEQAEDLVRLLTPEHRGVSVPDGLRVDGASNWRRLKADLETELHLFRELNQAIVQLEGRDHQAAKWLRDFAGNEEHLVSELRDLVLKCDTYALD